MDSNLSSDDGYDYCEDNAGSVDQKQSAKGKPRGSRSAYRNIKNQVAIRLLHLGKRLLSENTVSSHNDAVEIATVFLKSIPPRGYIPEDLFTFIVSIFYIHVDDEPSYKLFTKFMSMVAVTTPHLRPLILEHTVRLLTLKEDFTSITDEVQRRCSEWNLEKHEIAKHMKWIVKHLENLKDDDYIYKSQEFIVELEDALTTYLNHRRLPKSALLEIYIKVYGRNALNLLNEYIDAFPTIAFLRDFRINLVEKPLDDFQRGQMEQDLSISVEQSGYSPSSLELLIKNKESIGLEMLLTLLLTSIVVRPHIEHLWYHLLVQLLDESHEFDETIEIVKNITLKSSCNIINNFKVPITRLIPRECIFYYIAVGAFILDYDDYVSFTTIVQRDSNMKLIKVSEKVNGNDKDDEVWSRFSSFLHYRFKNALTLI